MIILTVATASTRIATRTRMVRYPRGGRDATPSSRCMQDDANFDIKTGPKAGVVKTACAAGLLKLLVPIHVAWVGENKHSNKIPSTTHVVKTAPANFPPFTARGCRLMTGYLLL